jgi:D-aminoacyl-tRNA deacylase
MDIAIVVSKKDQAGLNIKRCLLDLFEFKKTDSKFDGNDVYEFEGIRLYTAEQESIYCDNVDLLPAEMIVFATKHQSASGIHSLSVHSPGNWGTAEFGGSDKKLCVAPASYLKAAMIALAKNAAELKYEIIQECTHHGPYITKPCFFIEIGSAVEEWTNRQAGEVIAETIIEVLQSELPKARAAVGIGGLHHTPNFKEIVLISDIAVGHVCPKYNLPFLNKEMLLQAIEKTVEKVEFIVVDWKGLGTEKERVVELVKQVASEKNIEWMKTRELK